MAVNKMLRTLLVEGDRYLRNLLKVALPRLDARLAIEAVGTKEAALSALPAGFDCLVTDTQLPGDRFGGLAVLEAARAFTPKARVVVTSSGFTSMTITRAQECGAKVLTKIFDTDDLLRLLVHNCDDTECYSNERIIAALWKRRLPLKGADDIKRGLVELGLADDGTLKQKADRLGCTRQRLEYKHALEPRERPKRQAP